MDSIITMNKNCKGGTDMAHQKEGDSMGLFKKKNVKKSYDRECMKPVIRASICTGEQVAGFKDIQTGKLEEIMLIKSPKDLDDFKNTYGITEEIEKEYETTVNVVAITTKTRGNLVDAWGIDLARVLKNVEETGVFPNQHKTVLHKTSLEIAEAVDYDVLIEMTPLDMNEGQVATEHIMAALKRGKHVICANKGPLAWHYRELMELADENNCKLLFESTVMDGAPLFSLIRESLKMCEITEIRGILNSTTNYILQGIEQGKDMKDIVSESKKRGFIEANPKYDVEGTEAAAKLAALANAVMDADVTPDDVETTGIENVTKEMIDDAAARGNVIKLICRAYRKNGEVILKVAPEEVNKMNSFAAVTGTSLMVSLTTDLMGTLTIMTEAPEVDQAGYGIFSDLLELVEELN